MTNGRTTPEDMLPGNPFIVVSDGVVLLIDWLLPWLKLNPRFPDRPPPPNPNPPERPPPPVMPPSGGNNGPPPPKLAAAKSYTRWEGEPQEVAGRGGLLLKGRRKMRAFVGVLIGVGVGIAIGVGTGNIGAGIGVGAGLAVVFGGGAALVKRREVG